MTLEENDLDQESATERIMAVKQSYEDDLLSKPNVVGVAIGYRKIGGKPTNKLSLVVMVTQKQPLDSLNPEDQIPLTLEGISVDVQEVGEITAY
jgi:hypothetical protein